MSRPLEGTTPPCPRPRDQQGLQLLWDVGVQTSHSSMTSAKWQVSWSLCLLTTRLALNRGPYVPKPQSLSQS